MTLIIAGGIVSPNLGLAFWLIIVFSLVMFVLRKYAWGPITKSLIEREETIALSISRAEKALAEAKQLSEDNAKARRESELQAQQIIRDAREAAEALRKAEEEKTKAQIKQMQELAQAEIGREKQGALEALRAEVATLVIMAAEKVVKENLDSPKQRQLVDHFIKDLSKN
ncbi:MAG TPA: F0F1 ATP synthase subunit B [Rhodothermales bacterium]|nr:ATP synthase F0 subunit B [Bacteroidota bacterium]HRK75089.1 F0F1 ATP synthase subunit B [Rhodothermales bacterium]HRR09513.1 F0F1 ATP synthase subunit B [Rhodothermales bacterium]